MKAQTVWRVVGGGLLFTGGLTFLKIADELYTGLLSGSRSYGVTVSSHPVAFYVSLVLEAFCAALLFLIGFSLVRYKAKEPPV
jgi:hypothetical protein